MNRKKTGIIICIILLCVCLFGAFLNWKSQLDKEGIHMADDHIYKDYQLSEKALENATKKFQSVYESYITESDAKVYYALIPDKNYYLVKEQEELLYDYDGMYSYMNASLENMTYIEIKDLLSAEDYYYTDNHWRQDKILDVAQRLASKMGVTLEAEYETLTLDTPFEGIYYESLGWFVGADTISYLDHPMFESCTIINHEKQQKIPMYNMELGSGENPYEMFLSGTLPVITIENPNSTTEKELVIFRDSFGSSIAPLMVEGYAKITLIDIRYMHESMIPQFVEFTNQDVLFLYSTAVINNRTSF